MNEFRLVCFCLVNAQLQDVGELAVYHLRADPLPTERVVARHRLALGLEEFERGHFPRAVEDRVEDTLRDVEERAQGMPPDTLGPPLVEAAEDLSLKEDSISPEDPQSRIERLEEEKEGIERWRGYGKWWGTDWHSRNKHTSHNKWRSLIQGLSNSHHSPAFHISNCTAFDVEEQWCPDLWVALGSECVPTPRYRGGCVEELKLSQQMSVSRRALLTSSCGANYRCIAPSSRSTECANTAIEYEKRQCPLGYFLTADFRCQSFTTDHSFTTPSSRSDKITLTRQGFRWPCRTDCSRSRNMSALCPHMFSPLPDGTCTAPEWYEGPCPTRWFVQDLSEADKFGLERLCLAVWGCSNRLCIPDYSKRNCPLSHTQIRNKCVLAKSSAVEGCPSELDPNDYDDRSWALIAGRCKSEFPCA